MRSKKRGYFVFFDESSEECMVISLNPEQVNIDYPQEDLKISDILENSQISSKTIKISVNPLDKNGKPNFIIKNISRTKSFEPVEVEGDIISVPELYIETKEDYLKREKKFIKKTIVRKSTTTPIN